jgi:hypothetical protein
MLPCEWVFLADIQLVVFRPRGLDDGGTEPEVEEDNEETCHYKPFPA